MSEVSSVAEVLARLRAIDTELDSRDGVAVFNRVYLRVTELVLERLDEGVFHDDAFMAELDIRFARLWFGAYDAEADSIPHAWAALFERRTDDRLLPIQFALAGMNAHIEHDLAVAVVATCESHGRSPSSPGVHDDYERVNGLLADIEAEIRRSFLTEVELAIDAHLGPVAHLVSSWNIDKARDIAWVTVNTLWELRPIGFLADAHRAGLARTVGMGSRFLLTPLL